MEKRLLIVFSLFLVIINAELNHQQIAPFQCRSIHASLNRCNFQDLSSKFNVDEFSKFLQQLDFQNAEIFKSIIQNSNISKGEIKINFIKFAFTFPENFKQIFITVLENFINISKRIETEFDKIIENGSMEAKIVYNQIKNIYKNDNLTLLEECQQIKTIINASPSTFITELENLFGPLTNNCISNLSLSDKQNVAIPLTSESPSIGNNPPYDFQKGLIIPENQTPNNFDLNQIFGGLNNNNNNVGKNPLNGQDLIGTFNEVILLVKNLNNLINGLQNLYNLNGLLKFPNGFNLGSILPVPPVSNNNLNLPSQNMFSNFNLNNLLTPNNNNNNNVAMSYPNYYNLAAAAMDKSNLMYGNQNSPNYRNPFYPNYPYQT